MLLLKGFPKPFGLGLHRRSLQMPIGLALKSHPNLQNGILSEQVAGDRQPERQSLLAESHRQGERRNTAQCAENTIAAAPAK